MASVSFEALSPLAKEFAHKITRQLLLNTPYELRSPRDVLAHRAFFVEYMFSENAALAEYLDKVDTVPDDIKALQFGLSHSVPYLWLYDMYDVAVSTNTPEHIISPDILPFWSMWFAFDKFRKGPEHYAGIGLIAGPGDMGLDAVFVTIEDLPEGKDLPRVRSLGIPYGAKYPQDFSSDPVALNLANIALSLLSFINSPHIVKDAVGLTRNERRTTGLDNSQENTPRFVLLRRDKEVGRKRDPNAEPGEGLDWQFRWAVSGHKRHQWCPSTKSHKLIWIDSYFKGPEDKPLKQAMYKVAR